MTALNQLLNSIADAGLDLFRRRQAPKTPLELCRELMSTVGEASGIALARQFVESFRALARDDRLAFFQALRSEFHVDAESILDCARAYHRERDDASLAALMKAVESPRQELFRRINMAPDGTAALVAMRRDLLSALDTDPGLRPVDDDLAHLLSSWFNRGFLILRRIDWNTPAAVLERIIEYESVHAIAGWDDLRRRLAADRRCFAFFHGAMPEDPLIFVEVALVKGMPSSIQPLLDHTGEVSDPASADTAIFYSINNCHEGLKGVSFGHFLIKQVMLDLARECPHVETFGTLSPVPGLCRWLSRIRQDATADMLAEEDRALLERLDDPDWYGDAGLAERLGPVVTRLAARYLVEAKSGAFPRDAVARFHLRNGARLERINWQGDLSDKGIVQSASVLVNYLYDLKAIERNHESYVKNRHVAASPSVLRLARR